MRINDFIGKSHSILQLVKYILWVTVIVFCLDIVGIHDQTVRNFKISD